MKELNEMDPVEKDNTKAPGGVPEAMRTATESSGPSVSNCNRLMDVREVMAACGISQSRAYTLIRDMNKELKAKGFYTIAGKVPRKFFNEKMYC